MGGEIKPDERPWDERPPKRKPRVWEIILIVVMVFGLLAMMAPKELTPAWLITRRERRQVEERIKSAGGWDALVKECDALMDQHQNDGFGWRRELENTNFDGLPPVLAALKPQEVIFYTPTMIGGDDPRSFVFQISLFGRYSHDSYPPYYGLEIPARNIAQHYDPNLVYSNSPGWRQDSYLLITNRVFEIHRR